MFIQLILVLGGAYPSASYTVGSSSLVACNDNHSRYAHKTQPQTQRIVYDKCHVDLTGDLWYLMDMNTINAIDSVTGQDLQSSSLSETNRNNCDPFASDLCEVYMVLLTPSENWAKVVDWNIANYELEFETILKFNNWLEDNAESFDSLDDSFALYIDQVGDVV